MTRRKKADEGLQLVLDALAESILNASDQEIIEEIKSENRDPDVVAKDVQAVITASVNAYRKQRLVAAQQGYRQTTRRRLSYESIPENASDRLALLTSILTGRTDLPKEITMAFREGKGLSEDDVLSVLEDLAELGFLDDTADKT